MRDVINYNTVAYAIFYIQRNEHRGALVSEIEEYLIEPGARDLLTRRLIAGIVEALVGSNILSVETETVMNNDRTTRLHLYRLKPEAYKTLIEAEAPQEIEEEECLSKSHN